MWSLHAAMDDSDDSGVDEATCAIERAKLQAAMGTDPQPLPPAVPIPSRLGEEARFQGRAGAGATHGGGGSEHGDGDDDESDDSDNSETVAQERAAMREAMGVGGSELGSSRCSAMGGPAPSPFASNSTSAPNPNSLGALALQRALMANLDYQRLCFEELAAINRVLDLHQQADNVSLSQTRAAPQNAHEALLAASSIPGAISGVLPGAVALAAPGAARRHAAHGRDALPAPASYRTEGEPFFLDAGDELEAPEPNEDAVHRERVDRRFPLAPAVPAWGMEERHKLRAVRVRVSQP